MNSEKKIKIYLAQGADLLLVDLSFRIIVTLLGIYFYLNAEKNYIAWSVFIVHFFILIITLYYANRRLRGIKAYLHSRLLSHDLLQARVKSKSKMNGLHSLELFNSVKNRRLKIFLLSVFATVASCCLIFKVSDTVIASAVTLFFFIFSYLLISTQSNSFIKRNIVAISVDEEYIDKESLLEIKKYLDNTMFLDHTSIEFWNDGFIVSLNKDFNIYKEKLETFLLESVFLGALTFTTFIQLLSQTDSDKEELAAVLENINSLEFLNISSHMKSHVLDTQSGFAYLFIGSIISSVMYIIILLKRFSIIKSIEQVRGKLNLAEFYNQKEEVVTSKVEKINYSKQIQVELAYCEEQKIILDSNFKLITFFRYAGLLSFSLVVLVSAIMVNVYFFYSVLTIVIYVMIAMYFMKEDNLVTKFIYEKNKSH